MIPTQLPVFIQVVKKGSFSGASRAIGISPAAVSKSITQLEQKLNQRLFHRSTHALTLTDEGRLLFERTASHIEALDENIQLSMDASAEVQGRIKINLPNHYGQTVILPLLASFHQRFPKVEFDLSFSDQVIDLVEHGFDIGVGNRINEDSRLIARPFSELQLMYVCSRAYIDKFGEPKTPDELHQHQCIAYCSPTSGRVLPWNFMVENKRVQWAPKSRFIVNNPEAAYRTAKLDLGIACIGHTHLQANDNLVQVLQAYLPPPSTVWLYYPSRTYQPMRTKALIEHLLKP